MKKVVKDMIIVFVTILVIVAIASYWYWKSDNAVGPNLITAFVGVAISALVTLVLLNGQTKEEEKKDRNLNLYNAKLKVYSNFVSSWYKALSDNQITPGELRGLRTMLFGKVFFYVNKTVLEIIEKELKLIIEKNENIDANDSKMQDFFIKIVSLLQKDLNGEPIIPPKSIMHKFLDFLHLKQEKKIEKDNYQRNIWLYLDRIITKSEEPERNNNDVQSPNVENIVPKQIESVSTPVREEEILPQQAWHFIMWSDTQIEKMKEGFKELSLIEYGEYWRTNLVKQVGENDIVMLFRRGGYGYVGAYKAIGWRVFYFEEDKEEILLFGKEKQEITGDQYLTDIKTYDIYNSYEDDATTCANIIVEPIAFVENGVGNPGGVYRRTISRYDSHYAWLLKKEFQKIGQWKE